MAIKLLIEHCFRTQQISSHKEEIELLGQKCIRKKIWKILESAKIKYLPKYGMMGHGQFVPNWKFQAGILTNLFKGAVIPINICPSLRLTRIFSLWLS